PDGYLPVEAESEVEALSPEVRFLERHDRPGRGRGTGHAKIRDLVDVQVRVNLVARSDNVGPVQQRVAHENRNVAANLPADVDADLRDDGEFVVGEAADVARQRQQATRGSRRGTGGRGGDLRPANVNHLVIDAKAHLRGGVHEPRTAPGPRREAELAAVE